MSLPRDTTPDPAEAHRRRQQEPLLSSVVRAAEAVHGSDCPDAECLALYADDALTADEARLVVPHLRSCERCQEVVGAYRRASAAAPAGSDAWATPGVPSPRDGAGGLAAWLAGWRWLVPATSLVAVMVVAVWMGRAPAEQVAEDAQARQEAQAAPGAEAFVPPAPQARADAGRVDQTAQSAMTERLRQAPKDDAEATRNGVPAARALSRAEERSKIVTSSATQEAIETPAATGAADAAARPGAAAPAPARAARQDAPRASESAGGSGAAADASTAAPRTAPELLSTGNHTVVVPVDPRPALWRVSNGGIERSRDAGTTWQHLPTPAGVTVTAVASPSADVCWAIGDHAVLRATDGQTFTHEPVPTTERLTGLTASGPMAAVVMSAGGGRFFTTDGGRTWRRER